MPVPYVQCLVCGRVTPVDRGICYHCGAPLPSEVRLPLGTVVCPNCLRVTSVETGYCRHCKMRLPSDLVREAKRRLLAARHPLTAGAARG
ncbi:MAG: zinc ribbon domain-containing protein, partial [Desulfurococcales archaeon]|nr:zinc ribbon domain-containing protein [Desulfurococcales archaeon]